MYRSIKLKRKHGDGFTKSGVYFARRSTAIVNFANIDIWGE